MHLFFAQSFFFFFFCFLEAGGSSCGNWVGFAPLKTKLKTTRSSSIVFIFQCCNDLDDWKPSQKFNLGSFAVHGGKDACDFPKASHGSTASLNGGLQDIPPSCRLLLYGRHLSLEGIGIDGIIPLCEGWSVY